MFCRRKRCMMNRFLRCGGFYGRSWESDSIRIFDRTVSRETKNFEPQATAVELAQLGEEDDSPQCGEMSRRDKRARHPLKMEGKLPSLTEVLIRHYCNLREVSKCCSPFKEQKNFLKTVI